MTSARELAERLRKAANEMRAEDQLGWPVLCDSTADFLEAAQPVPGAVSDAMVERTIPTYVDVLKRKFTTSEQDVRAILEAAFSARVAEASGEATAWQFTYADPVNGSYVFYDEKPDAGGRAYTSRIALGPIASPQGDKALREVAVINGSPIATFVQGYQFDASDEGIVHTPTFAEQCMIEDAICSFISDPDLLRAALSPSPDKPASGGEVPAADDPMTAFSREAIANFRKAFASKDEVAWLIERKGDDDYRQPHWYVENIVPGRHGWTTDANQAARFATKAEAEAYPAYHMIASDPAISITEHVFLTTHSSPDVEPASGDGELAELRAEVDGAWVVFGNVPRDKPLADHIAAALNELADIAEAERSRAEARLAASSDTQGMVLVPREPTEEMIEAHFAAHARAPTVFAEVRDIWHAMLDAALTSTAEQGERPFNPKSEADEVAGMAARLAEQGEK